MVLRRIFWVISGVLVLIRIVSVLFCVGVIQGYFSVIQGYSRVGLGLC